MSLSEKNATAANTRSARCIVGPTGEANATAFVHAEGISGQNSNPEFHLSHCTLPRERVRSLAQSGYLPDTDVGQVPTAVIDYEETIKFGVLTDAGMEGIPTPVYGLQEIHHLG